jgi:hypothetical protein
MNAKRIGNPQTRTQIMRILYAVEYQQQSRLPRVLDHAVEIMTQSDDRNTGCNPLVPCIASQTIEPPGINRNQPHITLGSQFAEVARTAVLA